MVDGSKFVDNVPPSKAYFTRSKDDSMQNLALILILLASPFGHANEAAESTLEIMVVSKMTGLCGALSQMVTFQEATKMEGGDAFMIRFFTAEAARLGHTLDAFVEQCKDTTQYYQALYTELESAK